MLQFKRVLLIRLTHFISVVLIFPIVLETSVNVWHRTTLVWRFTRVQLQKLITKCRHTSVNILKPDDPQMYVIMRFCQWTRQLVEDCSLPNCWSYNDIVDIVGCWPEIFQWISIHAYNINRPATDFFPPQHNPLSIHTEIVTYVVTLSRELNVDRYNRHYRVLLKMCATRF